MRPRVSTPLAAVLALAAAASPTQAQGCPDPEDPILLMGDIYHIDGGDLLTVLANPFPDDSLVGDWIEVNTSPDQPPEFFQIISNQFFAQGNTSVFTVAEDLESAGGSDWWLYSEQDQFNILANGPCTPPAAPGTLTATAGDGSVLLDWPSSTDPNLAGYNVYRSTASGGPYAQLNGSLVSFSIYTDAAVVNGTTYYYVVTAVNLGDQESGFSNEASATPQGDPPPTAPTGLTASAGDGSASLDWDDNTEPDLAGYLVHRGTASGGPYSQLTPSPIAASAFADAGLANGVTYYYVVSAVDTGQNASGFSNEAAATPAAPPMPWINEFHYDNQGKDKDEFIEVAGPAGFDLSGWTLYGYNGKNGRIYKTVSLGGSLPDQQGGFGTLAFFTGLQNGAPDGLALVDPAGGVVEFLSYEGVFTGNKGPAKGLLSTDVGVQESSATPVGYSLQLGGTGGAAGDFAWQSPLPDTPGSPNAGQTFSGP